MGQDLNNQSLRKRVESIIFRHDTTEGRSFDIVLLILIFISVILVMLESVESIDQKYHRPLIIAEYFVTFLFTIEYILRIWSTERKLGYMTSFYGIIDLLSLLPTYLTFFLTSTGSLAIIRGLRLLRIFRIFKLGRYTAESRVLSNALKASRAKITVFITTVIMLVSIIGTLMN